MEKIKERKSYCVSVLLDGHSLLRLKTNEVIPYVKKQIAHSLAQEILKNDDIEIKESFNHNRHLDYKEFRVEDVVLIPKEEYERLRKIYELFWGR